MAGFAAPLGSAGRPTWVAHDLWACDAGYAGLRREFNQQVCGTTRPTYNLSVHIYHFQHLS